MPGSRSGDVDSGGIPPQLLQPVEVALFAHEDVDHEVHVVHQDPLSDAPALDVGWTPPELLAQPFLDGLGDGQDLSLGIAVAYDELIGDVAQTAEIQDQQVFGLLVQRGRDTVDDLEGYLWGQRVSS